MIDSTSAAMPRMHVALETADLDRAIGFYTRLFGRPPAKARADWAKFELDTPPVVFSLNLVATPSERGRLSHLGIRVSTSTELAAIRRRLDSAGLAVHEEIATTCCYARSDKLWVEDPDGNAWEFYVLLADVDAPSAANRPRDWKEAPAPAILRGSCTPGGSSGCC
ncbi:MAG: ArsI/CadI family heavy metal resistance metalloenzyme [Planctomycetota bacterium]